MDSAHWGDAKNLGLDILPLRYILEGIIIYLFLSQSSMAQTTLQFHCAISFYLLHFFSKLGSETNQNEDQK